MNPQGGHKYSDTKAILRLSNKLETSTFEFNSFNNIINFGDLGPGRELLSFNLKKRLLAVGVCDGVYVLSTFDLHKDALIGQQKAFNYRMKFIPQIKLRNPPLKIRVSKEGDFIGVQTSSGILFYLTNDFSKTVNFVKGSFKDFDISGKGFIGILGFDNQFRLFRSVFNNESEEILPEFEITCFSFSTVGGRILLGTVDGMINLFHLGRNKINTRFCLPPVMRQPIRELNWFAHKFCFVGLLNPREKDNKECIRGCMLHFSKELNGYKYEARFKLFQNNFNKTSTSIGERRFSCQYFDHWNSLCVTTNDCNRMEILEEYDDGWFSLHWPEDHHPDKNTTFFNEGKSCKGFIVDWSWRIPVGEVPLSPMLVFLTADGNLVFKLFTSLDENENPRKYDSLDLYDEKKELQIYLKHWKRLHSIQKNIRQPDSSNMSTWDDYIYNKESEKDEKNKNLTSSQEEEEGLTTTETEEEIELKKKSGFYRVLAADSVDHILGEIFSHFEGNFSGICLNLLEIRLVCRKFNDFILNKVVVSVYMNVKAFQDRTSPQTEFGKHMLKEIGEKNVKDGRIEAHENLSQKELYEYLITQNGVRIMSHYVMNIFQFREINLYSIGDYNEFVKRKHGYLENLAIDFPFTLDLLKESIIPILNSRKIDFKYELDTLGINLFVLHSLDVWTRRKNLFYIQNLDTILLSRLLRRIKTKKLIIDGLAFTIPGFDKRSVMKFIQSTKCKNLRLKSRFVDSYWPQLFSTLRNQIQRVEIELDILFPGMGLDEERLKLHLAPLFEYIREFFFVDFYPILLPIIHEQMNPDFLKKKKNEKKKRITKCLEIDFLHLQEFSSKQRIQLFEVLSRVKIVKIYLVNFKTKEEITDFIQFLVSSFHQFEELQISNLSQEVEEEEKQKENGFFVQGGVVLAKVSSWIGIGPETQRRIDHKLKLHGTKGEAEAEKYPLFLYKKHCNYCGVGNEELLMKKRKLKICSRCSRRFFCSKECQRRDWKEHKKMCKSNPQIGGKEMRYFLKQDIFVRKDVMESLYGQIYYECKNCGLEGKPLVQLKKGRKEFRDQRGDIVLTCRKCGKSSVVSM